LGGQFMRERRKARRYEIYLPLQVCVSSKRPAVFHTAQLRDISATGVYFHLSMTLDPGARMELTFALPTDNNRGTSVLIRASAKALRVSPLQGEEEPLFGVAASIDRIDFVRQVVSAAGAA
jgi:PilZ domain